MFVRHRKRKKIYKNEKVLVLLLCVHNLIFIGKYFIFLLNKLPQFFLHYVPSLYHRQIFAQLTVGKFLGNVVHVNIK